MEAVFMWLGIMIPLAALMAAVWLGWSSPPRRERAETVDMKRWKTLDRVEAKAHRLAGEKQGADVLEQRVDELAGEHVLCSATEDEEAEERGNA